MGLLRTLLAISVIFAHSYGFVLVGGQIAVQIFYMISGFLISFIIVEKKSYSTLKDFYLNRYLRIFPTYAIIATLTLLWFFRTKYTIFSTHTIQAL
ncbi:acyltransferase family protein [Pseudomonas asplenii]|uniref:acyltransferase family protein n=1 Tax=Pseudomonas asplenii TaxID=53407 RepID=UPI000B7F920C